RADPRVVPVPDHPAIRVPGRVPIEDLQHLLRGVLPRSARLRHHHLPASQRHGARHDAYGRVGPLPDRRRVLRALRAVPELPRVPPGSVRRPGARRTRPREQRPRPLSLPAVLAGGVRPREMSVLVVLLSLITWIPGMLLFLFQSSLEGAGWMTDNVR